MAVTKSLIDMTHQELYALHRSEIYDLCAKCKISLYTYSKRRHSNPGSGKRQSRPIRVRLSDAALKDRLNTVRKELRELAGMPEC